MNRYGQLAYDHTRRHRPRALASMTDPIQFFTQLGEEVAVQITQLRDELLGRSRAGESLEDYRRRSYQARQQAEEVVLEEMVWLPPEETEPPSEDEQVLAYRADLGSISTVLAAADRDWTDTPAEGPGPP